MLMFPHLSRILGNYKVRVNIEFYNILGHILPTFSSKFCWQISVSAHIVVFYVIPVAFTGM